MPEIKNPEIVKLLKRFETMPEYIANKYKRYHEEKEFRRRVFEKACTEAGLLRPGRFPGFSQDAEESAGRPKRDSSAE